MTVQQIVESISKISGLSDGEYELLVAELSNKKDLIEELEDLTDIAICKRRSSELSMPLDGNVQGLAA